MQGLHRLIIVAHILLTMGCGHPTDVADEHIIATSADSDTSPGTTDESGISSDTYAMSDTASDTDSRQPVCAGRSATPGDTARTVYVGNEPRSYILHIPSAYSGDTPAPLILDFHALQGSGEQQRDTSPYPAVTDPEGVIMAFPNGLSGPAGTTWNFEACCVDGVDDVAFSRAIVSDVGAIACIDASRVYAVGKATGGGMVHHLACHAADVFAAVSPASFDLIQETVENCKPRRPLTVISFRVTDNPFIPYEGGYSNLISEYPITFLGAIPTLERWAEINGCTGAASDIGNGCRAYASSQCNGGAEVWLCTTQGEESRHGDPDIAWPIMKEHVLP